MIRKRSLLIGASAVAALVVSAVPASAHVSPTTYGTTYTAGVTNVFALRVPHSCADPDTVNSPGGTSLTSKLVVTVPASVTSVKPQFIPGWTLSTVKSPTGAVTEITWQASSAAFAIPDTSYMDFGIRATLMPYVADEPGYDYFETLDSNLSLLKSHRTASDGRVRAWVGLEHLLYCSPTCFRDAMALAEEYDTGLHTHSSESIWEVQQSLSRFGRRPIEEFFNRGILSERTVVAHCVWLDDREIELMAQTGTSAVHCPCSNMKLASGPARVRDMRAAGIAFGLGSDGEKENNNLDLFEEMKFASLLQKVSTLDPTIGDPWEVLTMATIEGAKALGLDDVTGSLEAGKRADIVMVDLGSIKFVPTFTAANGNGANFNVAAHLVFTANGDDVDSVWVDGVRLVEGRTIRSVDEASVIATGQAAAEELFERRAAVLAAQ